MADRNTEDTLFAAENYLDGLYRRLEDAEALVLQKKFFYATDPTTRLQYSVTVLDYLDRVQKIKYLDVHVFNSPAKNMHRRPISSKEFAFCTTYDERSIARQWIQRVYESLQQDNDHAKEYRDRIEWMEVQMYRLQYNKKSGWPDDNEYY